jgi:hypothetical protein
MRSLLIFLFLCRESNKLLTPNFAVCENHKGIQMLSPLRVPLPKRCQLSHAARAYRSSPSCPSLPTIPTCPAPTCPCARTPPNLDIDRARPLRNTMAPHAQHLVIFSGQRDWTIRIEDDGVDTGWGELGRGVKQMMSAREGGEFADVS